MTIRSSIELAGEIVSLVLIVCSLASMIVLGMLLIGTMP